MNKTNWLYYLIFSGLTVVLFVLNLFIGSEWIEPNVILSELFSSSDNIENVILFNIRLPRAITSLMLGAALSVSGVLMQSLFRNSLAGPFVLGISSGSGLGVALLILAGTIFGISLFSSMSIIFASTLGTLLVLLLILLLSKKVKQGATLLIIGVMIGTFVSSIISVLQFFSDAESLKKFILWTLGSTSSTDLNQSLILSFCVFIGLILAFAVSKSLNAFLMGESYAKSLGISIQRTRLLTIISVGILAGAVTAFCGPIAFIGLAVPHVARNIFKTSLHNVLIPSSILLGMSFMLLCDIIAQMPFSPYTLPINAVTSLIGAPIVIAVIVKNKTVL